MKLTLNRSLAALITAGAVAVSGSVVAPQAIAQGQQIPNVDELATLIDELSSGREQLSSEAGTEESSQNLSSDAENSSTGDNGEGSSSNLPFNPLWLLAGAAGLVIVADLIFSAVNARGYTTIFS